MFDTLAPQVFSLLFSSQFNYNMRSQCFRQTTSLQEFRIEIRDGSQKNEKRANLALSFYQTAGLTQVTFSHVTTF